jgi:hypothetical protein
MTYKPTRKDDEHRRKLELTNPDKKPHWQVFGKGFASAVFEVNRQAGWLTVDTTETAVLGENKFHRKRTMITLDPAANRALYEMLRDHFEPDARLFDRSPAYFLGQQARGTDRKNPYQADTQAHRDWAAGYSYSPTEINTAAYIAENAR